MHHNCLTNHSFPWIPFTYRPFLPPHPNEGGSFRRVQHWRARFSGPRRVRRGNGLAAAPRETVGHRAGQLGRSAPRSRAVPRPGPLSSPALSAFVVVVVFLGRWSSFRSGSGRQQQQRVFVCRGAATRKAPAGSRAGLGLRTSNTFT